MRHEGKKLTAKQGQQGSKVFRTEWLKDGAYDADDGGDELRRQRRLVGRRSVAFQQRLQLQRVQLEATRRHVGQLLGRRLGRLQVDEKRNSVQTRCISVVLVPASISFVDDLWPVQANNGRSEKLGSYC